MEALRNRDAVIAVATAAGVWAIGWGINFVALRDYSSPRGHASVLIATIAVSAIVAVVGVRRALGERMSHRRALLAAIGVGAIVAAIEASALIVVALLALSRLDGS